MALRLPAGVGVARLGGMRGSVLLCLTLSLVLLVTSGCGLVGGDDDDDGGGNGGDVPEIGELDIEDVPVAPAPEDRPEPVVVPVSQVAGPPTGPVAGSDTYTVQSGDVCSGIATDFGITTGDLEAANEGLDCGALQVGQQLTIPPIAEPDEGDGDGDADGDGADDGDGDDDDGGGSGTYTVVSGDTAGRIADACGITVDELAALNPEVEDISALAVDQVINVPEGCTP